MIAERHNEGRETEQAMGKARRYYFTKPLARNKKVELG
jgi:hypothetical protein